MTNTSFRIAPWADCLYAMDIGWWKEYVREVDSMFQGERTSRAKMPSRMRVTQIERIEHYNNSGAAAISLAAARGATRIVLLGYDCQHTGGKAHWHGNHPSSIGNAGSVRKWAESFGKLAESLKGKGVDVINATRQTALDCFKREELEVALAETP